MSEEAKSILFKGRPIGAVSAALSAAQGEFPEIKKSKEVEVEMKSGGKYTYHYADLADILTATRPALAKHFLSLFQATEIIPSNGREMLVTTLAHQSGEYLQSETLVPSTNDIKTLGGLYTYLRRYQASAMLGIAPEEDTDAKRLDGVGQQTPRQQAPKGASQPRGPANASQPTPPANPKAEEEEMAKVGQAIDAKIVEKAWTPAQAVAFCMDKYKGKEPHQLNLGQRKNFLMVLETAKPPYIDEPGPDVNLDPNARKG